MQLFDRQHNKAKADKYNRLNLVIDEIADASNATYRYDELSEDISDSKMSPVLASFEVHDTLDPKIWDSEGEMDKEVRLTLLQIADEFIKTLSVKWAGCDDIILTGSLANYNWSRYSDFDLHVLIDFNKVDERRDFVKEYFDAKKNIWNNEHSELKIKGYPVELYVQDTTEDHTATGVYSLEKERWLRKPSKDKVTKQIDKDKVKTEAKRIAKMIDNLSSKAKYDKDGHRTEETYEKVNATYDALYNMRKKALVNDGEMSDGNITFKALRRLGYVARLRELKNRLFDRINSIGK